MLRSFSTWTKRLKTSTILFFKLLILMSDLILYKFPTVHGHNIQAPGLRRGVQTTAHRGETTRGEPMLSRVNFVLGCTFTFNASIYLIIKFVHSVSETAKNCCLTLTMRFYQLIITSCFTFL